MFHRHGNPGKDTFIQKHIILQNGGLYYVGLNN